MTGETDHDTEYHLREALRHLGAAQDRDDLRKTNAVAIEEVSQTIATVLSEHSQDES
ncbi:hypothetical protein ACFO5R_17675 [Halosolutus amylolyticus]|uniref:Uncharacterized protein n=1 Tax=Halosolutus amylolyticus TaxID=2932267 RepID=A0ABD5PT47_9EURY|nr:hypothetical protein [Halosolutus amylolyticus]